MDPDRWAEIETIFHAARERPASERQSFVALQCQGDGALLREVQSLLDADTTGSAALDSPAWSHPSVLPSFDLTGRQIGPYRLVRRLGRGGMGEVYFGARADGQFTQQVAVKCIRTGMASTDLVRRFQQERQILAGLDHAGIARLIDGGATDEGLPFLVMEYIEGEPIDAYVRARTLPIAGILSLVRSVCDAVDYAHRRLIVHRDIKPGNILVTPTGHPKLLDFGVAKLLSDTGDGFGAATATAGPMTLEYASPEQVRGEAVTTASDVYSLGLVLFRLITGTSPYTASADSLTDITRAICETEATRPSSLRKDLSADVDAIILKALRKEPERRYRSADQMAADIERCLTGLPVLARQGTWSYRAGKFVRRRRWSLAAAALVAIAGTAAVVSVVTERARAVRRFDDVRALARAVVFDYHDAIAELPGSTPVRERLVRDALTYLDRLRQDAVDDVSLQEELASAYQKIGDIQGNAFYANLGETGNALASLTKSLELRAAIARLRPADSAATVELARSHDRVGDLLWGRNDLKGAVEHFRQSVDLLEGIGAADSPDVERRIDLGAAHEKMADVLGNPGFANLGESSRALEHYRRSLAIRQSAQTLAPSNEAVQSALFGSYHRLGAALRVSGDPKGALEHVRQALAIQEALHAADPTPARQRTMAIAYSRTSDELELQNQLGEARAYTAKALEVFERLYAQDQTNLRSHREVAVMLRKTARQALKAGDGSAAEATYRRANAITEAHASRDSGNAEATRDWSVGLRGLGDALLANGRTAAALVEYRRSLAQSNRLLAVSPGNVQARGDIALTHAAIGAAQLASGDVSSAVDAYRRSLAEREALMAADLANVPARAAAAAAAFELAEAMARHPTGVAEDPVSMYRRAAELWTTLDREGTLPAGDRIRLTRAAALAAGSAR